MDQVENKIPNELIAPEKQVELCNAINVAIAADKIVTIDVSESSVQIAGAFPNDIGVILVMSYNWHQDCVPIMWFKADYQTILARTLHGTDIEVIHMRNCEPQFSETMAG